MITYETYRSLSDITDLLEQSKDAFVPSSTHPAETPREVLEAHQNKIPFQLFGFVSDGAPVSYISALPYGDHTDIVAIGPMYVSQSERGKGLGRMQVEEFIKYATSQEFKGIFTKTWGTNTASQKIFESLGFKVIGTKENDRIDGSSTLNYMLNLTTN